MIYSKNKDLEDRIIERLIEGNSTIKALHRAVSKEIDPPITLRAVYKSVNKLIDEDVLLKVGKEVLVNSEWVDNAKLGLNSGGKPPLLSKGEKIVYHLSSISQVDAYWKTVTSQIRGSDKFPIFVYNPHDFWIHIPERRVSESLYYHSFTKEKKYLFLSVGETCNFDKKLKKEYECDYFQIDLCENTLNRIDHITILEDYVITVTLTPDFAKYIDELYKKDISEEEMVSKIEKISQKPQKIKIVIENNRNKAKKLRKQLSKNFYIPSKLKEEYELF